MDRREFLFKGVFSSGLAILGMALAWIFSDLWTAASRFSSARWVPLSPLDQMSFEGVVPFPEHKVALLRKGQKLGAISLECTHLGCLVNVVDRGFFCPCHGSDFGPLGQVYSGPASSALAWHELVDQEGRIWVRLGKKFPSPQWVEVRKEIPKERA
ncbi:MAG: Rieske (2Fe-2S) protein [Deltaproteobacteria bacterium]|nr:Rieske (2Fe-2S) protein [Deltaproteobacteria bacterium]